MADSSMNGRDLAGGRKDNVKIKESSSFLKSLSNL